MHVPYTGTKISLGGFREGPEGAMIPHFRRLQKTVDTFPRLIIS